MDACSLGYSNKDASRRVAFYANRPYCDNILEPVYKILKDRFTCLISRDASAIVSFRPHVLLLTEGGYWEFRPSLPETIMVDVRHGFNGKNHDVRVVPRSDFYCLQSEWELENYLKRGLKPRLGFWLTGYAAMDGVFNPAKRRIDVRLPDSFRSGSATLLYAPTCQKYLTSVHLLGDRWIDAVRLALPDLNIIMKPHPGMPRRFPEVMVMWERLARRHERVMLVEDTGMNVYDLFQYTDILVSDASSVMFFFLAYDKPIVLVNNPLRRKDREFFAPEGPEWTWRDMGIEVDNVEELVQALVRSCERPQEKAPQRAIYRERLFGSLNDGCAAERIGDKVGALLDPAPEDVPWVREAWNKMALFHSSNREKPLTYRLRKVVVPLLDYLNRYPALKYTLTSMKRAFLPRAS